MKPVRVGLMLATVEDLREAALPLFEAGEVDAVEWSLDLVWNGAPIPDWCSALLDAYGDAGRLYAHGVQLSLLSAEWNEWHERWLENAAHDCAR